MLSPSPRPPPSAVEEEAASISSSSANNPLIALFLRTNAEFGPRLDSSAWDYLTVRDLCRLRASSRTVYDSLEFVEYDRCRDGRGECAVCDEPSRPMQDDVIFASSDGTHCNSILMIPSPSPPHPPTYRFGQDYLVPFPGYPGVLSTEADAKAGSG
jgi:hypothetical protein